MRRIHAPRDRGHLGGIPMPHRGIGAIGAIGDHSLGRRFVAGFSRLWPIGALAQLALDPAALPSGSQIRRTRRAPRMVSAGLGRFWHEAETRGKTPSHLHSWRFRHFLHFRLGDGVQALAAAGPPAGASGCRQHDERAKREGEPSSSRRHGDCCPECQCPSYKNHPGVVKNGVTSWSSPPLSRGEEAAHCAAMGRRGGRATPKALP